MKSWKRRIFALSVGVVVAAVAAELLLRIYNPIPMRLRGTDIVLPTKVAYQTESGGVPGLDPVIVVKRNSLGLRGEEPPEDPGPQLTMFTVGGSTTECIRLGEGKTWSDLLLAEMRRHLDGCWLNNAGLDGHSTVGHIHLLHQAVLSQKPDYVILLVGLNDIDQDEIRRAFDLNIRPEQQPLARRLVRASELLSTIQTIYRAARAKNLGLAHIWQLDLARSERGADDPAAVAELRRRQRETNLPGYRERLETIITMTRANGTEPVLITQPALFGDSVDPHTGQPIGSLMHAGRTASLWWSLLRDMNDVTRSVGKDHGVFVVELADQMPKDSSLYYDWTHYTNAGAERVAAIVASQLVPFLQLRHPDRIRRS